MNDKTGKAIAAAISGLAKAIDRLAATRESGHQIVQWGGASGGAVGGTWTDGAVGGSPGGIHPRVGGGGGGPLLAGGAALTIVGEAGPEYLSLSSETTRRSA